MTCRTCRRRHRGLRPPCLLTRYRSLYVHDLLQPLQLVDASSRCTDSMPETRLERVHHGTHMVTPCQLRARGCGMRKPECAPRGCNVAEGADTPSMAPRAAGGPGGAARRQGPRPVGRLHGAHLPHGRGRNDRRGAGVATLASTSSGADRVMVLPSARRGQRPPRSPVLPLSPCGRPQKAIAAARCGGGSDRAVVQQKVNRLGAALPCL